MITSAVKPATNAPPLTAPPQGEQSRLKKFAFGGIAGMMATCVVQPMDLIKNRMQLSGEGGAARQHKTAFHAIANIARAEGLTGMYNGLSAGLLRQATYTTTRLGVFQWLEDTFGTSQNIFAKLAMGMTAGGVGAFVGNPAEVALVRMTADGRLPPAERRNYSNALVAVARVAREEGVTTLWRGTTPTVARAMVLNAAQLGGYAQAKETLKATGWFGDTYYLHFAASLIAAVVCTAVSIPIDISKTRLQTMKKLPNGTYPYSGTVDVMRKVVQNEGIFALWKGFTPYFLRLGPHTIITFMLLEQMRKHIR